MRTSPTVRPRLSGPIAYLIPEFPGQTHIFIWREISQMRRWGVDIQLFSTRPPPADSAARHTFATRARDETEYLWPRPLFAIARACARTAYTQPIVLGRAVARAWTKGDSSRRASVLPLLAAASVLAAELRSRRIRHVHVHSAGRAALLATIAQDLTGVPYSVNVSTRLESWGGGMRAKLENAAFVVVPAQWLRDQIEKDYPTLTGTRILVAPTAVDTERWTRAEAWNGAEPFRLVTVARLHPGKRHDLVIRTVARLRASGRDVRLEIVGGGAQASALAALVRRLGLTGYVGLSGSLPEHEVMARLKRAHTFVLASEFEALPVSCMEAMAAGVPTIATEVGGVGEIITDGRDGLLVPAGDGDRLAVAIERVMDDAALRARLADEGRTTIVERFDSRIGAAAVYERLFGQAPSA